MSKRKSRVWNFFDELDNDPRKVKCNQCQAIISRGGLGRKANTTSMNNHVKYKHPQLMSQLNSVVKSNPDDSLPNRYRQNKKEEIVAVKKEPFSVLQDVIDENSTSQAEIQVTKINDPLQSSSKSQRFKGTTGNLSVHLKRYHEDALDKIRDAAAANDEVFLESDEEVASLHGQDIYFEEIDDQVKCTVCGKNITDDGEDPRGHLEEHHPGLLARIIKDEDRVEEEEAQNEKDIFTEVVYLDEVSPPQVKKRPAQTKKLSIDNPKKRKLSTDSDEYVIKSKKSTEIDSFTTYIRVLLEKLPQDVCSRLQLEIINLIMAAQFNLNSKTVASTNTVITDSNYNQEGD